MNRIAHPKGPPGQKPTSGVSKKVRDAAKGQTCTLRIPGVCSHDPEKTVACHVQAPGMGIMAGKANDMHTIHGCTPCHFVLDNRARWAEAAIGWDDVLRALIETQERLHAAGLLKMEGEK